MPARLTRAIVRGLDRLSCRLLSPPETPEHQQTGQRGEEDAYFYLRRKGYTIVARNFRSPRRKGEIDLIGWDGPVLSFIEVKTRTSRDVKPAEAAVNQAKQKELAAVAREYLRRMPPSCQWRFDVVTVYYEGHQPCRPDIELFKNAFPLS
jgi:putative endonuclease